MVFDRILKSESCLWSGSMMVRCGFTIALRVNTSFGFNLQEPTYTRHLTHLEEKEYIIRERGNFTNISLNVESIESKTKLRNAVQISLDYLDQYKEDASELDNKELFEILKKYCMEKVSSQFLLKL